MHLFVLTLISISFSYADPVMDMIQAENYPAEKHTVQTKDGYILSVYRIPNVNARRNNHRIILLMHGITMAAPIFLTMGRNISSGYKFADAGFDVWIGNSRCNTFSRHHITKHPNDPTFWDFSWHEIGVFDIPATIDYILEQTNKTKLSYVGYSQGVSAFYVMLSELPQYNDKIAI
ncbi:lipase 1-like, partial [Contarinia nasturtii]|uniref:lipase 1-like n=1 Tax=Contarinia nasturtii TaxID=265458 RepID=UPI0012D487B3